MAEDWLEIADENIDVETIMRQIRVRVAQQEAEANGENPEAVAKALWQKMIDEGDEDDDGTTRIRLQDTDIVPRSYVIDWRLPIIGPIHSVVRRVINAEIRRFLMPSLNKQANLNRQLVRMIKELRRENEQLRQKIEALTNAQDETQ